MTINKSQKKLEKYYTQEVQKIEEFIRRNGGRVRFIILLQKFSHGSLSEFFRRKECRIIIGGKKDDA